jgi:hypothetical protein
MIHVRSRPKARPSRARAALVALSLLGCPIMIALAQSVSVARAGDNITVRASEFAFIKGEPLARLKDGRSVRVDLELDVLPGPGGAAAARGRRTFVLSYDLWEERFAVTQVGSPVRSIDHLRSAAAEAWCLEQLTVPVSALGRLGRELPFWIRLGARVLEADAGAAADDGGEFTLRGLIDALSRRRRNEPLTHAIEAGPFRLPQ